MSQGIATESLTLNFFQVTYLRDLKGQKYYLDFLNKNYSLNFFEKILTQITKQINVQIIKKSDYRFEPFGTSFSFLIAEKEINLEQQLFHLDKSHVGVHTYYFFNAKKSLVTLRTEFDLASCGEISPLKIIPFLLKKINHQIVLVDFKARGGDFSKKKYTNFILQNNFPKNFQQDYFLQEKSLPLAKIYFLKAKKKNLFAKKNYFLFRQFNNSKEQNLIAEELIIIYDNY